MVWLGREPNNTKQNQFHLFLARLCDFLFVFLEVLVLLLCAHNPHALIFIYIMIYISRCGGPRGARGARAPLRIGDVRTKIFEN